jgi:nucleolar protein 9
MPKANKKRGRRAETKRKLEGANDEPVSSKRQKQHDPTIDNDNTHDNDFDVAADYVPLVEKTSYEQHDRPFYGLLDEEEQEYFRKAGEMLELNQFTGPEDRHAFVESVYKQADNKELKLANSQSCSRVLERLIQLSSPTQLKTLFQKFSGKSDSLH